MRDEMRADVLIVGGGTGGCAAALVLTDLGLRVIMTQETDWVGGQLTSQAVPPDEHGWIEDVGGTRRYRRFRHLVRQYYRDHYPLTEAARAKLHLNPGLGTVSGLCCEPKVALAALRQMMAWAESFGLLRVLHQMRPVSVDVASTGNRIEAVTLVSQRSGERTTISARYVLDATELGDLLPLSGAEYVTGAESRDETGEPHAVSGPAQPRNNQALSWCFPVAYDPTPGADYVIPKPASYERWSNYVLPVTPPWAEQLFSWTDSHPHTLAPRHSTMFDEEGPDAASGGRAYWRFRRVLCAEHYPADRRPHEVSLVNWPMIDYIETNIIDQPEHEVARGLEDAKQLSLSFLYWLQTQAPRPNGNAGYPGLYLRPDITGTDDGLAMGPYIRESRRIRAMTTVTENHVGREARRDATGDAHPQAFQFNDSVGTGYYRIDLHPSTGGNNYIDISALPFQIPLGALVPVRLRNLLPAGKNIGSTHITNGCYRLHPVEWNIGEAAGLLAAFCLTRETEPQAVAQDRRLQSALQDLLSKQGIDLAWPEAMRRSR